MQSGRVQWIDFAKGVVIILVVILHAIPINKVSDFNCTFHMPFFFVMAGYLLNTAKWSRRWQDFKSKLNRRLLVPYFLANFLWYPVWFVACYCFGVLAIYDWAQLNPLKELLAIFIGNNYTLGFGLILGPLWFLPCLLYAELIYLKIYSHFSGRSFLKAIFLLAAAGYLLGKFFQLPLGLDIAMVSQVFLLAGGLIKKYNLLSKLNFGAWLILLTLPFVEVFFSGHVEMNNRSYSNLILFYAAGIAGSLIVMKISMLLALFSNKIFDLVRYCGRQSLIILILHVPVFSIVYQATILIDSHNAELGVRYLPLPFCLLVIICGVLVPVWIAKKFSRAPVIKNFCA